MSASNGNTCISKAKDDSAGIKMEGMNSYYVSDSKYEHTDVFIFKYRCISLSEYQNMGRLMCCTHTP